MQWCPGEEETIMLEDTNTTLQTVLLYAASIIVGFLVGFTAGRAIGLYT
jgi:hypothetical protein